MAPLSDLEDLPIVDVPPGVEAYAIEGKVRQNTMHAARLDLKMPEQDAGATSVFRRDQLDRLEHLQGPKGDVVEIADRRRDDVQDPL